MSGRRCRTVRLLLTLAVLSPPVSSLAAVSSAPAAGSATDAEAARLALAGAALPGLELDAARARLRDSFAPGATADAAIAAAGRSGLALWRSERGRVQAGDLDDRGLYWRRLAALEGLRVGCAAPEPCAPMLREFELASRGLSDLGFDPESRRRVVVTGFDPFNLDTRVDQSNPSGLAALQLDDTWIGRGDRRAQVQALVLPVRFADFDEGLVEAALGPLLQHARLDLLLTVSMGREGFDLERFPGRRRSASAPDNQGVVTGASAAAPVIPRLGSRLLPGPEFVEFSLPVSAMLEVQRPYPVRDNRRVATLERGRVEAASVAALANQIAVSGSGGGYLSNEVSFRSVRLARELGSEVAVGHLHTPRVQGHDREVEAAIVGQVRALLQAALESLP